VVFVSFNYKWKKWNAWIKCNKERTNGTFSPLWQRKRPDRWSERWCGEGNEMKKARTYFVCLSFISIQFTTLFYYKWVRNEERKTKGTERRKKRKHTTGFGFFVFCFSFLSTHFMLTLPSIISEWKGKETKNKEEWRKRKRERMVMNDWKGKKHAFVHTSLFTSFTFSSYLIYSYIFVSFSFLLPLPFLFGLIVMEWRMNEARIKPKEKGREAKGDLVFKVSWDWWCTKGKVKVNRLLGNLVCFTSMTCCCSKSIY